MRAGSPLTNDQGYSLCLEQVPFAVCDQEAQGIAETEMKRGQEMERDPDALKVFGGSMT